jgi:formylglycine-generating enzyme required for sulfatase activity
MAAALDISLFPLSRKNNQDFNDLPGLYAAQGSFRTARGRSLESLVVHLALDGTAPLSKKELRGLVKHLADTYFKTPGSSTTAMRIVVEQLNDTLIERNSRGANRSIQSAGLLTLAVFREDRLYLAQCGPTHALLITVEGSTHFYLSSLAWRGLGFGRVPNIRFHQLTVSPGDRVLISKNPPQAWTKIILDEIWQLPLEEIQPRLMEGGDPELEAALILVERGTGEHNSLQISPVDVGDVDQGFELSPKGDGSLDQPFSPEEGAVSVQEENLLEEMVTREGVDLPLDIRVIESIQGTTQGSADPWIEPIELVEKSTDLEEEPDEDFQVEKGEVDFPTEDLFGEPRREMGKFPPWVMVLVGLFLMLGTIIGWMLIRSIQQFSIPETSAVITEDFSSPLPLNTEVPNPTDSAFSTGESTVTIPAFVSTSEPPSPTTQPIQSPTEKIEIGATQISPKDEMVMVYVPAGDFQMGGTKEDENARDEELPRHTVYLKGYWIDQTEVTNAQYSQCVADGDCDKPYSQTSFARSSYYSDMDYADYPVIFVSWYDAVSYCEWAGRNLPSEAEWEKAARGVNASTYPWGDEISCDLANYGWCQGDTTPVGKYLGGASPYGLLDMAGNVWEWVADYYYSGYYADSPLDYPTGPESGAYRVIRGGSWNDDIRSLRTSSRYYYFPDNARVSIGFRCVGISSH